MFALNPSSPPSSGDLAGAFAVLAAITDPESAAKSLAAFRAVLDETAAARDEYSKQAAAAAQDRNFVEQERAKLDQLAKLLADERADFDKKTAAFKEHEASLAAQEADINERQAQFDAKCRAAENELTRRQVSASAREQAIQKETERLASMRKELEDKLERLKAAVA